jgi:hypothetical protein
MLFSFLKEKRDGTIECMVRVVYSSLNCLSHAALIGFTKLEHLGYFITHLLFFRTFCFLTETDHCLSLKVSVESILLKNTLNFSQSTARTPTVSKGSLSTVHGRVVITVGLNEC